jgi:prophage DNA circulation protein
MAWIDELDDASFRSVAFQVEKDRLRGGKRLANHQYPKRNKPNSEDLGLKQKQFSFDAFIIGVNGVFDAADKLIDALDADGSGLLIHPSYGQLQVQAEDWTRTIDYIKERNIIRFQLTFVESGDTAATTPKADTAHGSAAAADQATSTNTKAFTEAMAGTRA